MPVVGVAEDLHDETAVEIDVGAVEVRREQDRPGDEPAGPEIVIDSRRRWRRVLEVPQESRRHGVRPTTLSS